MFRPPSDHAVGPQIELIRLGDHDDGFDADGRDDVRSVPPKRISPYGGQADGAAMRSGRSRRSVSRRWWVVAAMVASVATAFAFMTHVDTPAASDLQAAPGSRAPARSSSSPSLDGRPNAAEPGSTTTANSSANTNTSDGVTTPIYANSSNFGLYFFNEGSGPSLARLDLATGVLRFTISPPDMSATDHIVGATGSSGNRQLVWASDVSGGSWAPCSDGTVWVLAAGAHGSVASLQRLRFRPGIAPDIIQSVDVTHGLRQMLDSSLGTTTGDRPVVSGPDGRGYVVDPSTGEVQRESDGLLLSTQQGAFVESVCDAGANCYLTLHSGIASTVSLNGGPETQVSFSPDGTHALVVRASQQPRSPVTDVLIVDMQSRRITSLDRAALSGSTSAPSGRATSARDSLQVLWTPDGGAALFVDNGQLVRIALADHSVARFPVPGPVADGWKAVIVS